MSKRLTWLDYVALIICFLPLAYQIYLYPQLPERVAMHFNYKGEPDRWGDKSESWLPVIVMTGVALGGGLLVRFLPVIDPKKKIRYSQATLVKVSYALVFFLTVLNLLIVRSSLTGRFSMGRGFYPVMGLFFVYIGNLFSTIKPNYFLGIRTPWTLESEAVWRKTHQWGGRLWVMGGLVITASTLVLPQGAAYITFMTGTVCLALAPVIFSYWYYRKLQHNA